MIQILKKHFNNKKVLITGHTGFKGSWLTSWMLKLGANVQTVNHSKTKISHALTEGKKKISKEFYDIIITNKIDRNNLI